MTLSQFAQITISRQTAGVSQVGFGTPLILGHSDVLTVGQVKSYSSSAAVLEDFASSDNEYLAAVKVFSQTPAPPSLKIARSLALVAQAITLTPDVSTQAIQDYDLTLDGVDYSFTSDSDPSAAEVVTGLQADLSVQTKVTPTGTVTLVLTAANPGEPFTLTGLSANLVASAEVDNVGYADSIAAIQGVDNDWAALIVDERESWAILLIAAYIESVKTKIYGVSTDDAEVLDPVSTTDIAYLLKAGGFFKSFYMYSGDTANFPEAGLFGRVLPLTPGSETWAYKSLAGVTVDVLSDTAIAALKSKNANYYLSQSNNSFSMDGITCGGEWIDIMRFIDWVEVRQQEAVLGLFLRNNKVAFTDPGIGKVDQAIRTVLETGQDNGGIPEDTTDENGDIVFGFTTTFPRAASVSVNDKALRNITGSFNAKLAGAIHFVGIDGVVTL